MYKNFFLYGIQFIFMDLKYGFKWIENFQFNLLSFAGKIYLNLLKTNDI